VQSQQTHRRKRLKPRSPYAVELRRLGQKVKPNKKRYTRKGRSQNRPFDVWGGLIGRDICKRIPIPASL
jgi:hypothetical protein